MSILIPDVTLICLAGGGFLEHQLALLRSSADIDFGAVKMVYDHNIKSIDDWNFKIVYELHRYVLTSHALLIHADGYVINPDLWNPDWLQYDYIGAPWPLPRDDYSYRDEE